MYVDAHHHLWDLHAVSYPWLSAKGVARFFGNPEPIQKNYLLKDHQKNALPFAIKGSVHIQVGAKCGLVEAKWVDQVGQDNPDWPIVQVAFADLTVDDLGDTLDQLQSLASVRGIRQILGRAPEEDQHTGTQQLLNHPAFSAGLAQLTQRGLRFDLQLIPELIEPVAEILQDHPKLPVALCHAGSPHDRSTSGLAQWQKQLRKLSDLPSVYCKLSGLGMFQHHWGVKDFMPIVEACLEQFSPSRCMFGSNFPVDSLYSSYEKLFQAYQQLLLPEYQPQVFAQTARDFYDF